MTPYKIGDRVVYLHPSPTMGTALAPEVQGMVLVDLDDGRELHADPNSLRPAMPRDRHDLERWGDRWWVGDNAAWVTCWLSGAVWFRTPERPYARPVSELDDWRGPVAPPPKVRS
ncbi:MAG: hypothetical protein VW362_12145 [Candidatus Nanopelagicales bacterium]